MQIRDTSFRTALPPTSHPAPSAPGGGSTLEDVLDVAFLPSVDPVLRGAMSTGGMITPQAVRVEGELTRLDDPTFRRELSFQKFHHPDKGFSTMSGRVGDTAVSESSTFGPEGIATSGLVGPEFNGDGGEDNQKIRHGFSGAGLKTEGHVSRFDLEDRTTFRAEGGVVQEGFLLSDGGAPVSFQRQITPNADGSSTIQGQFGGHEEKGRVYQDPEGFLVIDRTIGNYHLTEKVKYQFNAAP